MQKDKVGSIFLKPFRAPSTKDRNNAVRTELLKVLGQAFNIEGVTERDGKTRFSDQFMRRLEEILGPDAFKCGDFGIKDGAVDSGKPLTQRRITAIIKAACAKSESGYDANAYLVKVEAIADAFKGKNPDALSTSTARRYVDAMKQTIALLESELAGFDAECPDTRNFEKIYGFFARKAHLLISTDELRSFLERAEADTKPAVHDNEAEENQIINIDDIPVLPDSSGGERRTRIKTYLTDRLQTMVKTSVDICLKAIEAGKIDVVMAIILKDADLVEDTLRDLEEFRRTQLVNEIAEDDNQIM